jgi:thioredoxin
MAGERMTTAIHGATEFDDAVLRARVPVLVDFWARWCGPCRALAPALDDLAREVAGRARIVKVDVDENPDLARQYDVSSIPCLVIFRNGREAKRIVGLTPKARIAAALDTAGTTGAAA